MTTIGIARYAGIDFAAPETLREIARAALVKAAEIAPPLPEFVLSLAKKIADEGALDPIDVAFACEFFAQRGVEKSDNERLTLTTDLFGGVGCAEWARGIVEKMHVADDAACAEAGAPRAEPEPVSKRLATITRADRRRVAEVLAKLADCPPVDFGFVEGDVGIGVVQTHEVGLSFAQTLSKRAHGGQPVEITSPEFVALAQIAPDHDWPALAKAAAEGDPAGLAEAFDTISAFDLAASDFDLVARLRPASVYTNLRFLKKSPEPGADAIRVEILTPGNQFERNGVLDGSGGFVNLRCPIAKTSAAWLKVGTEAPEIVDVDGRVDRYRARDVFKWAAGAQGDDLREFYFEGKIVKGRHLFERDADGVWKFYRPADQEMASDVLEDDPAAIVKCAIEKVDEDRRLVTGAVLVPGMLRDDGSVDGKVDAQGDVIDAATIEKAAHEFLSGYNRSTKLGLMHKSWPAYLQLVESYVAPHEITLGAKTYPAGTWIATSKVLDDEKWGLVKSGRLTGYSIGGILRAGRMIQGGSNG